MKNLIVIGHPDKKSFCYNGILKTLKRELRKHKDKEELEVIDLCRPCRHLTEVLGQDNILKEFLRRGGLRCQVLSSSSIKIGDEIKILNY